MNAHSIAYYELAASKITHSRVHTFDLVINVIFSVLFSYLKKRCQVQSMNMQKANKNTVAMLFTASFYSN